VPAETRDRARKKFAYRHASRYVSAKVHRASPARRKRRAALSSARARIAAAIVGGGALISGAGVLSSIGG
jgi:hypothetical protein